MSYIKENYVKDKVIIITGASSGFGRATARKAAALGGKVVLAARREERLRETVGEIRAAGGEAIYAVTDVRCREQVQAMVKKAVDTYGRVDVLVNDAGTMPQAFFSDHPMAEWEFCLDTCIKGTLYGIDAVYDQMIKQEQGQVINISSVLANYPTQGAGVYEVAKKAVEMLADSLRIEARGKIKATTIKPGGCTKTELFGTVVSLSASSASQNAKGLDMMMDSFMGSPEGKNDKNDVRFAMIDPEDLADVIIYAIDQPWGVNISDITLRASGELSFA